MIIDYLVNLKSILVTLELGMADADFSGVKCLASYLTDVYSLSEKVLSVRTLETGLASPRILLS